RQYDWLGFGARKLIFDLLDEARDDPATTLDVLAYDLDEPDIVRALAALGSRLRLVQDHSRTHVARAPQDAPPEGPAPAILRASAGADNVRTGHFQRFQHNKVLVLRRNGTPVKALSGSANFAVRGLYVQSNNVFLFADEQIAGLYGQAFDHAWNAVRDTR